MTCFLLMVLGDSKIPDHAVIAIQPMGLTNSRAYIIDQIKTSTELNKGFKVIILKPVDKPTSAWYPPRNRYKADKILKHLQTVIPNSAN